MLSVVNPFISSTSASRLNGTSPVSTTDSSSPLPTDRSSVDAASLRQPGTIDERALVTDKDDEQPESLLTTAGSTAILVAGAFSGLVGTVLPTITQYSQPALSTVSSTGQVVHHDMAPVPFSPEQTSPNTHIIANVDATEPIIEPFATNDLGQYQKTTSNSHVTADVQLERNANPIAKLGTAAEVFGITAAPFLVLRHFAKKSNHLAIAIGLTVAGLAGSYVAAGQMNVMHDGVGSVISAVQDFKHPEGQWSGRHEMHMQDGQRTELGQSDSQKVDPDQIAHFIADHMKQYPEGNVVVSMTGHGLMYRHVSGVKGDAFSEMLAKATQEGGRPIDVLVLESCLSGNLETLNGIYPSARYAVVSEESIAAGAVGTMFENTSQATMNTTQTPRELAEQMLRSAKGATGVETLAVIDLSQLPQLDQTVDQLGASLLSQVKAGHTDAIRTAINDTKVFPQEEIGTAKQLAVGDLKQLAENLLKGYANDSSPEATAVKTAAQGVLDQLGKTVVGSNMTSAYAGQGGISIQLPGMSVEQLEKKANVLGARGLSSYGDAQAPESWRAFVNAMSPNMAAPVVASTPSNSPAS